MFESNRTWFCKKVKIEDAKQISKNLGLAINGNNHSEATKLFNSVKKYMKMRIDQNYFSPVKKVNSALLNLDVPENSAFIIMGINCILIELIYEIKNGFDESKDSGSVENAYKEILPLLDSNMSIGFAIKFYKGIRCGILHQGQTKDNTALTYQLETVFQQNGQYYLSNPQTVLKKLERLYDSYWEEISKRNYSDEMSKKLIKKFNNILEHIS